MPGEDVIERGAEPGQPAAQVERADLERQNSCRRREPPTARGRAPRVRFLSQGIREAMALYLGSSIMKRKGFFFFLTCRPGEGRGP